MASSSTLTVSELDFDKIKTNLKTYLQGQTEFSDYDFESSTLSILLNVLSYNTYHNAFYLNMVANEMFLDSAQLRTSVVSRAKMLNYTPRSATGATAAISATVTPNDTPASITVAANTQFTSDLSTVNSISSIYYLQENEDNLYEVYFGDNVFGKKPINGNIVIVDYRVVSGTAVNGANTFASPSSLGDTRKGILSK